MMMQDMAMHLLDIVQNSISADASAVSITITESKVNDLFTMEISDNGIGMDAALLKKVRSPYGTTRTTRKIGLGIPLLEGMATQCNGTFHLTSKVGEGTIIGVSVPYSHWDRPPLGNIAETVVTLLQGSPDVSLSLNYSFEDQKFNFSSDEIKKELQDEVSLAEPEILSWIQEYIQQQIQLIQVQGGMKNEIIK